MAKMQRINEPAEVGAWKAFRLARQFADLTLEG